MTKKAKALVAILAIVVFGAIVIPNFLPPRSVSAQNACVANLRLIQDAKSRWAEVYHKAPEDRPTESDLFYESNSIAAFRRIPDCPAGGTYVIGAVNEEPKCSTGSVAHSLHPER